MRGGGHARFGFAIAIAVLAADQLSKWWVMDVLGLARRPPMVLLPVLDLRLVQNRGITFGFLNGSSRIGPALLALIAIAVVVGLGIWLWRAERGVVAAAVGAIVGGAIGNVLDRLRLGFVVDFIQVHVLAWSWYIFNLADAGIVCGVAVLLVDGAIGGGRAADTSIGTWDGPGGKERR